MTKCMLFTEKLFLLRCYLIFTVLGQDTSTPGSMGGPKRCYRGVIGGRSLNVHRGQTGN